MSKKGYTKIEDQAAEWALKIEDGLTVSQETELEAWLRKHPDAESQLARFQKSWERFEILDPQHFPLESLHPDEAQSAPSIGFFAKKWRWAIGAAAAIAIFGIGLSLHERSHQETAYSTHTYRYTEGDFYELEDRSTLDLNDGAVVESKYSEDRREFWIKSGEAYFTVAKDPDRPFDVYAGETRLRALGTQFNVRFYDSAVEVLVTEGIVSLSLSKPNELDTIEQKSDTGQVHKKLIRNQKAVVHQSADHQSGYVVEEIEEEEVSEILLWKPVTLKFDSTPLSEVVARFNRYNDNKIVIADERIEALQIVATFRSNKIEGFINLLQATSNVVAEYKGNQIILTSKNRENRH